MNQTLSRWLACGACATGTVVLAAEPAAALLPVRAIDPPAAAVVRGAPPAPAPKFQAPASVPAPGTRPPAQSPTQPSQPKSQPSVWGGVKSTLGAKPSPPPEAKGWWPTSEPTPGVYAGPPAYRWYGYGTPTAGANPYAPTGRYPQPSGNWYAQTGATPGAFPVPVGGTPVTPREQPVVVQAFPQEPPRPVDMNSRQTVYRSGPEMPDGVPPRLVIAENPRGADRREPMMPSGPGVLVETPQPEVTWQPVSATSRMPIASTPDVPAPPKALPVPVTTGGPAEPPANWSPSQRPAPPSAPLPTVSITRGQAPADEPAGGHARTDADIDTAISSACFGRATRVGVTRPGPHRLHVTLVVPTEGDARDAAAVVSRLPELKAYSVTFEAVIGK